VARLINFNYQEKLPEIADAGMVVLEECCEIIVDEMKSDLNKTLVGNWRTHGPYQSGPYAGETWTGRESKTAMLNSIRQVKKDESGTIFNIKKARNIWVMAGNYKTWWAVQMEFGHGDWKGGKRPFFRSGINKSMPKIGSLIASRRIK
jgi:hypothetical protein